MTDAVCLLGLLIGLAVIVAEDIRAFRIPDRASLPLIAGGLLCAWAHGDPAASALGAMAGYAVMVAIETLYRRTRGRDGLGRGDAKLFAAAGAWTGWTGLPLVLLVAAGTGLLWAIATGNRDRPIPFGPFLSLGLLAAYLAARA